MIPIKKIQQRGWTRRTYKEVRREIQHFIEEDNEELIAGEAEGEPADS